MACQVEFFHVPCAKTTNLFSGTYVRRYTNHGCNVLRCFPHCCPHTEYRGCGSSISLRVVSSSIASTRLQAFATFQPSSAPQFQLGDVISAGMLEDRRSESHQSGKWLHGRLDDANILPCFHFNERRTEGWHYGWKGGASAKQRLETHQLCVYVVTADEDDPDTFKVVGSASSTPFLLGSYRRALFPPGRTRLLAPPSPTPPARVRAVPHHPTSVVVSDMRRYCQTLSIVDFPNDWRQFEQALIRDFQEWFGIDMSHCGLVRFDGHQQTLLGDYQGSRKAALKLLRWWMSPQTQHSEYNYLLGLSHEGTVHTLQDLYHKLSDFHTHCLAQFEPNVVNIFLRGRTRHGSDVIKDTFSAAFMNMWPPPMQTVLDRPSYDSPKSINGDWIVELNQSQMTFHSMGLSFFCLSQVFTMIFGLRINLARDILQVQSYIKRFPATPATLVLDSVPRRFETLVNGEPCRTLDPTLFVGDYLGWVENNTILLWIYGWPTSIGDTCYVLQVRASMMEENRFKAECILESCPFVSPQDFKSRSPEERIFRSDTTALQKTLEATFCYRRRGPGRAN
ncbi:hypothetical protein LEN26_000550 [Aphanomyces euteiches]|nr:hypothetical protein LEN26_000550 [Aphanomyces euteiches]